MATRIPLYVNFEEGRIEPFQTGDAIDTSVATNVGGGGSSDHGALTGLADDDHSQYHNDTRGDVRYYTKGQVDTSLGAKQDTLVSGTSIKTINSTSLLGAGDIVISGGSANVGEATILMGETPSSESSINVTGQTGILSTSKCMAWVQGATHADNDETSHLFAGISLRCVCGLPTAGVGFTIYVTSTIGLVDGNFKIKWQWI